MARTKNVTIQDVARAAGVQISTVSRVLNDKDDVAPDTYRRVHEVIAELGYTSSLAARSMRSRRTGVIGLIMPELEDSFCIQVIAPVPAGRCGAHQGGVSRDGAAVAHRASGGMRPLP